MDERTRQRMFEPFFTTKSKGKGTGLGLAAVLGCVQEHNGQIDVETRPGAGTTFRIRLPYCPEEPRTTAPQERPTLREGHGRILVVDDEELIRNYASLVLRRLGYQVEEAADGQAAIDRLSEAEKPFHLLLLDINMPGAGARDVLRTLHSREASAKVILCSGYASGEQAGAAADVDGFLSKPFGMHELVQAVQKVLLP
jgi:CheY-like chemotaxis protein